MASKRKKNGRKRRAARKRLEARRAAAAAAHPGEESFASRAIQASLDAAMGCYTDDEWLIDPYLFEHRERR